MKNAKYLGLMINSNRTHELRMSLEYESNVALVPNSEKCYLTTHYVHIIALAFDGAVISAKIANNIDFTDDDIDTDNDYEKPMHFVYDIYKTSVFPFVPSNMNVLFDYMLPKTNRKSLPKNAIVNPYTAMTYNMPVMHPDQLA